MRTLFFSVLFLLSLTLVLSQCPPETQYRRTIDGTCNNLSPGKENLGSTHTFFIRTREGVAYVNESTGEAVLEGRPNPRTVSQTLLKVDDAGIDASSRNGISLLTVFMGQFIAHDMAITIDSDDPDDRVDIEIEDDNDPLLFFIFPAFAPKVDPPRVIIHRLGEYTTVNGLREFFNDQTHWLDGSTIYFRDEAILALFLDGAKFLETDQLTVTLTQGLQAGTNFTLYNLMALVGEIGAPIDGTPRPIDETPIGGDERSAENAALNIVHLLFQREHNRLVDQLAVENPTWNETQLFEKARIINIAQYQHIVYKEFLPTVFGIFQTALYIGPYLGYKSDVDPSVSHLCNIANRWGHTAVREQVPLYENCGELANVSRGVFGILPQATQEGGRFSLPEMLALAGGVGELMKSLLYTPVERFDHLTHRNLREIVFNTNNQTGTDIPARNMNRGRWTGIPGWDAVYSAWNGFFPGQKEIYRKKGCTSTESSPAPDDLKCFTNWMENQTLAEMTRDIYGKVSGIDAWLGFLTEKKALGSSLGRTATKVILDQFKRLRDGDRFFYLRLPRLPKDPLFGTPPLTLQEFLNVLQTSMSDLIRRNFPELDSTQIQESAFNVPQDGFFGTQPGC